MSGAISAQDVINRAQKENKKTFPYIQRGKLNMVCLRDNRESVMVDNATSEEFLQHPKVVRSAGLDGLLDHVISVDPIRKFKTHPDASALGEQTTVLPRSQILFVSSNGWDALGATWFGYRTLWVNRQNLPFDELGTAPTRTASNLRDVLSFFD